MINAVFNRAAMFFHDYKRARTIASLSKKSKKEVASYMYEIIEDKNFFDALKVKLKQHTTYISSSYDFAYSRKGGSIFFPCVSLYTFARALRPATVLETGGTPGKSTAALIKALSDNNHGKLFTFDLPPKRTNKKKVNQSHYHACLPDRLGTGWIIPSFLLEEKRHTFIFGDTKETLPSFLKGQKHIDLFIHDSCHTYEHMMFEFDAAWPFIRKGGFLFADDVFTHSAFQDFARKVLRTPWYIGNYGVLAK